MLYLDERAAKRQIALISDETIRITKRQIDFKLDVSKSLFVGLISLYFIQLKLIKTYLLLMKNLVKFYFDLMCMFLNIYYY
jgi:hypothetical protein